MKPATLGHTRNSFRWQKVASISGREVKSPGPVTKSKSAEPVDSAIALVDTNVLRYAFDTIAELKRAKALDLFEGLWRSVNG